MDYMEIIDQKTKEAIALLDQWGNRSEYARSVLRGYQRWSGADLKGKAKKFGASYARQRKIAAKAWTQVGGELIRVEHGLIVSAVRIGDGYATRRGFYSKKA